MKHKNNQPMPISVEQAKLLSNTLRVKILGVLIETPKTSKQVATQIGESPGNVHYHMKQLHQGKLIDLVEEKPVGGVVEKYYLARSSAFDSSISVYPELNPDFNAKSATQMSLALQLKKEDQDTLLKEFRALMEKWVRKSASADNIDAEEFVLGVNLISREEKESDNQ
ncbi:helix-turn-helix transcriptional regulator [Ornithinibacillus gellani]|uniref:winged helix-turn-helix domain-containing protein n=1 Tax=Ornithinibacillus gellani TaxID=2293253 RepID=UPI000F49DD7F|nr:helix-turn-helix domain-containing protein [Ornithinibacillus gellani]TQS71839.1 helix-turn-helix transcriptional regulator [Ornithinibacillus gellani]